MKVFNRIPQLVDNRDPKLLRDAGHHLAQESQGVRSLLITSVSPGFRLLPTHVIILNSLCVSNCSGYVSLRPGGTQEPDPISPLSLIRPPESRTSQSDSRCPHFEAKIASVGAIAGLMPFKTHSAKAGFTRTRCHSCSMPPTTATPTKKKKKGSYQHILQIVHDQHFSDAIHQLAQRFVGAQALLKPADGQNGGAAPPHAAVLSDDGHALPASLP